MDNTLGNCCFKLYQLNQEIPIQRQTSSTWSQISSSSSSSGFESQPEYFDFSSSNDFSDRSKSNGYFNYQVMDHFNQNESCFSNKFQLNQSLVSDNAMESDIFNTGEIQQQQQQFIINYTMNPNYYKENSIELTNQNEIVMITEPPIQLWQYLIELLEDNRCRHLIKWLTLSDEKNYMDNEFHIYDPIEIARRWSIRVSKNNMNYKKFNRILRYYYKKNILQKTAGKSNTYHFTINIQPYLNQIHLQQQQQQQQQLLLQQQQYTFFQFQSAKQQQASAVYF